MFHIESFQKLQLLKSKFLNSERLIALALYNLKVPSGCQLTFKLFFLIEILHFINFFTGLGTKPKRFDH